MNSYPFCIWLQVILLERRSATGRVLYRTVTGGWNGSDDDKLRLHKQLEILQRDPSYLTHDAMLPELNNEFASVSHAEGGERAKIVFRTLRLDTKIYFNECVVESQDWLHEGLRGNN